MNAHIFRERRRASESERESVRASGSEISRGKRRRLFANIGGVMYLLLGDDLQFRQKSNDVGRGSFENFVARQSSSSEGGEHISAFLIQVLID